MMRRSPMKPSTSPMKRIAFARADRIEARETAKLQRAAPTKKAAMKTKQRPVSAEEKALWSRLAALGCVACMKDGNFNPHVSIHHVDGRTKAGCHQLVLPLCAGHHQDGTGEDKTMLAVHPWKAQFERRYGSQAELMATCRELLSTTKSEAATGLQPDAASVK
jgi:hypothetical protein